MEIEALNSHCESLHVQSGEIDPIHFHFATLSNVYFVHG